MEPLILVDVFDAHRVLVSRQRLPLALGGPPLVIGRDVACDVVLDDPYVAARHAQLTLDAQGAVLISDLGTQNGLILRGERLRGARSVPLGSDPVRIGHSTVRVRAASQALPPELPDRESLRARQREYALAACAGLACIAFAIWMAWLGAPESLPIAASANVVAGLLVLAPLLAFWTVLGRTRRSRGRFSRQAAITLIAAAACLWLNWASGIAAFATGVRSFRVLGVVLQLAIVMIAVYLHLRTVSWLPRLQVAVLAIVVPIAGIWGYGWYVQQQRARDVNELAAVGRMAPPAWSHTAGIPLDAFLEQSLAVRDAADARRAEAL